MFDIGSSELLLIVVVAIVVIGPKDLPRALYKLGQVIGKAKGMARHFRSGVDAMIREAELEELQKQWARDNERIMASTQIPALDGRMEPLAEPPVAGLPSSGQSVADEGAVSEGGPGEGETPPSPAQPLEPAPKPAAVAESAPPAGTPPGPAGDPEQPALPLEAPRGSSPA